MPNNMTTLAVYRKALIFGLIVYSLLLTSCTPDASNIVYKRELPTILVKNGLVEIKQTLIVERTAEGADFPYAPVIILTMKPITPSEVESVYAAFAMPRLFAADSNDLVLSQAPQQRLEDKPSVLFHLAPLKNEVTVKIQSRNDALDCLALNYTADGTYRFIGHPQLKETAYLARNYRQFIESTNYYAVDRIPSPKERKAAGNYFKTHEATRNQVRAAGAELSVVYATAFKALVNDSIDTLDRKTAENLMSYKSDELFAEAAKDRAKDISEAIPVEIVKKAGIPAIRVVNILENLAGKTLIARERVETERVSSKLAPVKKKEPEKQPAIILSKKGDTNNDGNPEKLNIYLLPDGMHQIKVVDSDNNQLFLSDPFELAPKSIEIKKDAMSKYPIYVIVFEKASGNGVFIGFDGQKYGLLTSESY